MKIKVYSEIGPLKKVLVHRPGGEVERLHPGIYERLLFDEIMDLKVAQEEHDEFTSKLRAEGVEVFYIERLAAEVLKLKGKTVKEKFVTEFVEKVPNSKSIKDALVKHFLEIEDEYELINSMIAGVKKNEVKGLNKDDLSTLVALDDPYPFFLDPIPNILFQRDPIASIFDSVNIHHMNKETRQREAIFYELLFEHHPEFKDVPHNYLQKDGGSIEGGDILVMNKETIFIGLSERTVPDSVELLASRLFAKYSHLKQVVGIEIPKSHATMHLDTVFTQMDHDKFSIDADMAAIEYTIFVMKKVNGSIKVTHEKKLMKEILRSYVCKDVKFAVVGNGDPLDAAREQWNDGANCLCIKPGVIIVYNRNRVTNELIKKMGVKIIEIPSGELSRGRGGPRCMSMPLEREEI